MSEKGFAEIGKNNIIIENREKDKKKLRKEITYGEHVMLTPKSEAFRKCPCSSVRAVLY